MDGSSDHQRQFEEYLRDGISATKNGQRKLAQSLLQRAIYLNRVDSRPYLWLAETTDIPQERIEYLEIAVGYDPANGAARRELALLKGKINPAEILPEGLEGVTLPVVEELQATGQSFECPRCGGRMVFALRAGQMNCEYCGYLALVTPQGEGAGKSLYSEADRAKRELDFVLPTMAGQRRAQAEQHLSCERCGAHSLLPPGQKAIECAYCGSNQVIQASPAEGLMEPQLIGLMKIDPSQAQKRMRSWLSKGFFTPDNLSRASGSMRLRPGYYSFWTYDGTVELPWSCEVRSGERSYQAWKPINGVERRFFNDVLVPGVKALDQQKVEALEPFDLKGLEVYVPEYLAGWPAVLYDRSLADGSLLAREAVLRKLRPQVSVSIEPGREKRNLRIGVSGWSGLTFKHILLPLWSGDYQFHGRSYPFMINGQTGEVTGEKPRDAVKIVFLFLIGVLIVVFIYVLYMVLSKAIPVQ